ncbi:hypothetical protein IQ279_04675 [Streptomyces verrucosisporus]|uniref:hypothetical protein n=1 Tax=Streptomyces verrucosisporus TaxID=1695161 RepID=UPI0019D1CC74|nr:hypothetical protein [Streptomyces verrucosisporus]MBN3928940.1 hypothetical protein [Streptomyces verrucosisporus]
MGKRGFRPLTWTDMQDSVDADIRYERERRQEALAAGDQEAADRHGRAIDSLLDERRSY